MNSSYNMPIMSEHYGSTDYGRSHAGYGSHPGQALAAAYHNKAANFLSVSHLLNLEDLPRQDCAMYENMNQNSSHGNQHHVTPPHALKRSPLSPHHQRSSCRRPEMSPPSERSPVTSTCALSPRHCADSPASDSSDKNTSGKLVHVIGIFMRKMLLKNQQKEVNYLLVHNTCI